MRRQYVTFRLGRQLLGLEILLVREINQLLDATRVQHAPGYIAGLANLRGQIVTIFDLGLRLGDRSSEVSDSTHVIILKSNGELAPIRARVQRALETSDDVVGLRVDDIGDVVEVEEDEINPVPANIAKGNARFLAGVVPLDGELLSVLATGELLRKDRKLGV